MSQFVNPIFVDNELNNLENIEIFDNGIDLPTLEEQEDALLPETNNEVVAVNVSNTFTYDKVLKWFSLNFYIHSNVFLIKS